MSKENNSPCSADDLLDKGVRDGIFPAAVLLGARSGRIRILGKAGYVTLDPEIPVKRDTIFDLASLTKPLATTLAIMKLVDGNYISLDHPLSQLIPGIELNERHEITIRHILTHSAGFPDWRPFYLDLIKQSPEKRKEVLRRRIMDEPPVYLPGKDSIYSDLGFMLLEWVIEETTKMSMDEFLDQAFYNPLSLKRTFLMGGARSRQFTMDMFAPTEDCPWRGKVIRGEVHDENAYVLRGYSGHAGLFGTAKELFCIVAMLREHYEGMRNDFFMQETVREFLRTREIVKGSTRALGWDAPSPENSSSGTRFSPNSIGHLGFTGTSLWWDMEKDIIIILLTNRIHPTRANDKIRTFRPMIHDAVMKEILTN